MAEITEVREKKQDWYTVKGVDSRGKQVSVDIPAPYVDGKDRKAAEKVFKESIERVGRASN